MDIKDLTPEEIELIKEHRKAKQRLEIKIRNTNEKYWDAYDSINFEVRDDKIRVHTSSDCYFPSGHQHVGERYSGSGYFTTYLSKEDVLKIKEFFELHLK